ncbi:hypothetical protein [Amycolatopsis sp. NPDC051128]|uniref:hypothetical protein n=1 Tax=Amycolatopsis sp. NPDC051128 TaxID=3155412 RepID=UPI003443D600
MTKFVQTIEFNTTRIDELTSAMDAWLAETEGSRVPTRGVLTKDRDRADTYVQIVEFPSYEEAMENSNRPETTAFAKSMAELCDGPAVFRNLDVLREEAM